GDRERGGDGGEGDLAGAAHRRGVPVLAVLAPPVDVLQHQNGVVHDHADRQRQRQQRHEVDREAAPAHGDEEADQRRRDRDADVERRAQRAQEQERHHRGQGDPQEKSDFYLFNIVDDEEGVVGGDADVHAGGEHLAEGGQAILDLGADLDDVGAGGAHDADADGGHAVEAGQAAAGVHAVLHQRGGA